MKIYKRKGSSGGNETADTNKGGACDSCIDPVIQGGGCDDCGCGI